MKGHTIRIAAGLEQKAIVGLDGLIQDFVVARKQGRHLFWMFLREFCAAFDISK
jgi:hypothetical protein